MKNGKILEQGPPKALFEKPFSLYAADYFGQKNIFAGAVQKTAEDRIVELKGGLKVSVVTELEGDVFIYIPPSDILITRKSREELQLEFGKEVYVAWKASAVHVFKEIEND